MAVAMLAVSGSAWAQDAAQGESGSVGVSAKGDPVIKPLNPKPGEKITDRTPTIKAKIFDKKGGKDDNNRKLKKKHIKLRLDGDRVKNFTYRNDRLKYTPKKKLSFDKHTVKIVAGTKGDKSTRKWSFKIKD